MIDRYDNAWEKIIRQKKMIGRKIRVISKFSYSG